NDCNVAEGHASAIRGTRTDADGHRRLVLHLLAGSERLVVDDLFGQQPGQNARTGGADDVGFGDWLRNTVQSGLEGRGSPFAAKICGSSAASHPELVSKLWCACGDHSFLAAPADPVQNICALGRRLRDAMAEIPRCRPDWTRHPLFF